MSTVSYQQSVSPNVVHYPFIVTIDEYARRCKIAVRSAHHRIRKGYVCHTHLDGVLLIDLLQSSLLKRLGTKPKKAEAFIWPTDLPPRADLVSIGHYCEQHSTRGITLHRNIILGKVPGWILADQLFIRRDISPQLIYRRPKRG